LATKLSWKFAALAPVCGWADDPEVAAEAIGKTPLWAFHGDKDTAVPVQRSIDLVEAIQNRGGDAKLTRYPDVGHDSWHKAYQGEQIAAWFLTHSL
jgi:predicted peptidase